MDTKNTVRLDCVENEELSKNKRYSAFFGFILGAFCTLTIVGMMAVVVLPDRGDGENRSKSITLFTPEPYNCYCLYMPNVQVDLTPTGQVISTPLPVTPTIVPVTPTPLPVTPTMIPVTVTVMPVTLTPLPVTPVYTWPNTSTLTKTTGIIWPPRQVVTGEVFTEQIILVDFDNVYMIETIIAYNPVVLLPVTFTVASNTICPIGGSRFEPGIVRIDCEGLDLADTGALFEITFICVHTGTTTIESAGKWATFAGIENGWGFWPDVGSAVIECK